MKKLDKVCMLLEQEIKADKRCKEEGNTEIIKKLKENFSKTRKALINFLNIVIGVGKDSFKLNNQEVEEEDFDKAKRLVLSEINKLINNENRVPSNFRENIKIGKKLKYLVDRIYWDQLDFDEKDYPMDYSELKKSVNVGIFPELDNKTPQIPSEHKSIMSSQGVAAKKMYNPDVFEDLIPYISALGNAIGKNSRTEFLKDAMGLEDSEAAMHNGLFRDQFETRDQKNLKERGAKMLDAIDKAEPDENNEDYQEARKREINKTNYLDAKDYLEKKDWKENDEEDEFETLSKSKSEVKKGVSANELYKLPDVKKYKEKTDKSDYNGARAKEIEAISKENDYIGKHNLETISQPKLKDLIKSWINKKIPADENHKIRIFGVIPGYQRGAGSLMFISGIEPKNPNALKVDGVYCFRGPKVTEFLNFVQKTEGADKYIEDRRIKGNSRSNRARQQQWENWNKKVLAAWKVSVVTESYFNY